MSTTMVKMRKQPKVVVTHGGRFSAWPCGGSGEELFRSDPFVTIVFYYKELFFGHSAKTTGVLARKCPVKNNHVNYVCVETPVMWSPAAFILPA